MKKLILIPFILVTLFLTGCSPSIERGRWIVRKVTDYGVVDGGKQLYLVRFDIMDNNNRLWDSEDFYTSKQFYPGQEIEFAVKNP